MVLTGLDRAETYDLAIGRFGDGRFGDTKGRFDDEKCPISVSAVSTFVVGRDG